MDTLFKSRNLIKLMLETQNLMQLSIEIKDEFDKFLKLSQKKYEDKGKI